MWSFIISIFLQEQIILNFTFLELLMLVFMKSKCVDKKLSVINI